MTKLNRESAVLLVLFVSLVALLGVFSFTAGGMYKWVPACPEDAVLVGTGQFQAGRWDNYVCGPALDDFTR